MVDTLRLGPVPAEGLDDLGDDEGAAGDVLDAASDDEDEPESAGLADATPGVAAIPAPMPRATANAPTRPIYLAYPIVVPFLAAPCLTRVLPFGYPPVANWGAGGKLGGANWLMKPPGELPKNSLKMLAVEGKSELWGVFGATT